jgi:hypothetical protein
MVGALLVANVIKHGLLSWHLLESRKDALSAANSALTICILAVGGVLSYFRFFRGRTFAVRGELDLKVDVLEAPTHEMLHVLTLSFRNVGTVPIWNPEPRIEIRGHLGSESSPLGSISQWFEPMARPDGRIRAAVLDAGEVGRFYTQRFVNTEYWAVTYYASIACETGDVWQCTATVLNEPTARHRSSRADA